MDLPPSPYSYVPPSTESSSESSNMAAASVQTLPLLQARRDMTWDGRQSSGMPSRPRAQNERIELPSIRQAVPEIDLRATPRDDLERKSDYELRESTTAGVYKSPPKRDSRPQNVSRSPQGRASGGYSQESWSNSNRLNSPFLPTPPLQPVRGTPTFESSSGDFRPTLPSLPSITLEREVSAPAAPRGRPTWSDYALDNSRTSAQTYPQMGNSTFEPPSQSSGYQSSPYPYAYQQPRGPSYPVTSHSVHHRSDRSPFSSSQYQQGPSETYMRDSGQVPEGSRHRKRRGNLPKETTDKLRAWFVAHLSHPYPTEDEKQDLMMQTGLQMNQISNWFINARRRQLPAMINNARAESEARSAMADDSGSREPASDSEGYEDDYDMTSERSGRGNNTDNS